MAAVSVGSCDGVKTILQRRRKASADHDARNSGDHEDHHELLLGSLNCNSASLPVISMIFCMPSVRSIEQVAL